MSRVLTRRDLARATLARQMLLRRAAVDPLTAIERLAGLNAQLVPTAYLSLLARIDSFTPAALVKLLRDKRIARANLMRGTIHLVSAADYPTWQPTLRPAMERTFRGFFAGRWRDIDPSAVQSAIRELLRTSAPTRTEMSESLGGDTAMFYARVVLPLVQIPPAGEWANGTQPRYAWGPDWFGTELRSADPEELILRYLAAFGPASVKDVQYWSGLTGLAPHIGKLAAALEIFEGENGMTLYDLPDAPRPQGRTTIPPRLIPEFDNLVFAHSDRTRFVAPEHQRMLNPKGGQFRAPILIDGRVAGTWRWDRKNKELVLSPFERIPDRQRNALTAEATRTAEFLGARVVEQN